MNLTSNWKTCLHPKFRGKWKIRDSFVISYNENDVLPHFNSSTIIDFAHISEEIVDKIVRNLTSKYCLLKP